MYVQRIAAIVLFVGCGLITIGWSDEVPNIALLENWLQVDEEFTVESVLSITLIGGEQAYLIHAYFPDRGHCCDDVTVLVRSEFEKAREIAVPSQTLRVLDLDSDGVSEIEGHGSDIGQGWFAGIWQIYQIDGWQPVKLYEYGPIILSNEGAGCGLRGHDLYNRVCEQRTVTLSYEDLNQDGVLDLIRTEKEDTFWFKAGTDEDIVFADDAVREQAIDPNSRRTNTSQQKYLYNRHQFIKQK